MNNKSFFKYIFALLLFGSNGIVASFVDLSSLQIVLLRTCIGSILLIALFFITGGKPTFHKHKKQLVFLAVSGIAMGASWMFLYEAYARIGVSIASLLYYCGPVIVMALSPLLFKEKGLYQKSQQNKIEPSAEKTVLGSKYLVEFKCEKKTAKH